MYVHIGSRLCRHVMTYENNVDSYIYECYRCTVALLCTDRCDALQCTIALFWVNGDINYTVLQKNREHNYTAEILLLSSDLYSVPGIILMNENYVLREMKEMQCRYYVLRLIVLYLIKCHKRNEIYFYSTSSVHSVKYEIILNDEQIETSNTKNYDGSQWYLSFCFPHNNVTIRLVCPVHPFSKDLNQPWPKPLVWVF